MTRMVANKGRGFHRVSKQEEGTCIRASMSPQVPLPEGQLFMWANNEFSGKCCDTSNVSGGGGCACITKEQAQYLNSRGGNRAPNSEF